MIYFRCPKGGTNYSDINTSKTNLLFHEIDNYCIECEMFLMTSKSFPTVTWTLFMSGMSNLDAFGQSEHEPLLCRTMYTGSTFEFRIYVYNANWLSRLFWDFCNVWNTKWNCLLCFMKLEVHLCFLRTAQKCSNSFSIEHNLQQNSYELLNSILNYERVYKYMYNV